MYGEGRGTEQARKDAFELARTRKMEDMNIKKRRRVCDLGEEERQFGDGDFGLES